MQRVGGVRQANIATTILTRVVLVKRTDYRARNADCVLTVLQDILSLYMAKHPVVNAKRVGTQTPVAMRFAPMRVVYSIMVKHTTFGRMETGPDKMTIVSNVRPL